MKPSATIAPTQLEPFLFAEIGTQDNGMMLSVASAFARLGLDPWRQATVLAELPDAAATASLASLIGRLQCGPAFHAQTIAARLIPLLPKASAAPPDRPSRDGNGRRGNVGMVWLFWAAVAAAVAYTFWA